MTTMPRRSFLLRAGGAGAGLALAGSLAPVLGRGAGATATARAGAATGGHGRRAGRPGYGPLVPDPGGVLELPAGFRYAAFSVGGRDVLDSGGPVPNAHDGMAAFRGRSGRTLLVRNHEINAEDVEEDGVVAVVPAGAPTYDPNGPGGTTTLVVDRHRRLEAHHVSLAGTVENCAGGPTPWGTWLSCEETDEVVEGVRHGDVFEVDPVRGGDPRPIVGLGRFEHEAVAFDWRGAAYLSEDADTPFGQLYRFQPGGPCRRRGDLHAGGALATLRIPDLAGTDLSAVTGRAPCSATWSGCRSTSPTWPRGRRCGSATRAADPEGRAHLGRWRGRLVRVVVRRRRPRRRGRGGPQRGGARRPGVALHPAT